MDKISINELDILFHYLMSIKPEPGIMLDVGGHFGESALPFLKAHWQVHSFEPDKSNLKIFKVNTSEFKNLIINNFAVSDSETEASPFYTSEESTGISSLLSFHHTHSMAGHVRTKRLDNYCTTKNIAKVDFLKIDTEGFDYKILCSFDFSKMAPPVILCEFDFKKTQNFKAIIEKLTTHGYEVIISEWDPIVKYGQEHSWHSFKSWPCTLETDESWGNILAFKDSVDKELFSTAIIKANRNKKKLPVNFTFTKNHYGKILTHHIRLQMEQLKLKGFTKICLFGAGKFTPFLLSLLDPHTTPLITSILDDNANSLNSINEYPIKLTKNFNFEEIDAVILSTDTHQKAMKQRCLDLNVSIPVIDLFDGENLKLS